MSDSRMLYLWLTSVSRLIGRSDRVNARREAAQLHRQQAMPRLNRRDAGNTHRLEAGVTAEQFGPRLYKRSYEAPIRCGGAGAFREKPPQAEACTPNSSRSNTMTHFLLTH